MQNLNISLSTSKATSFGGDSNRLAHPIFDVPAFYSKFNALRNNKINLINSYTILYYNSKYKVHLRKLHLNYHYYQLSILH
uniref:Uncharacterized protein n=1 Tax=Arundo donax TaxID=35708 RepID=A0A0A8Y6V0_ARUDO